MISLIFFVFSLIHFSRRIFSVALMSSLSFLISCVKEDSESTYWAYRLHGSFLSPQGGHHTTYILA